MASKTTNYGLNKHSPQDFYNVEARNENWDKIDEALAAADPTKITTKAAPADGDGVMIADNADGGKAKRLLWSSVKTALGKLFVPLARTVNGKTLAEDVTLTGENIAVSTTDPTPISGAVKYRTNPNLLDNWYFANPANQRNGYIVPAGVEYYKVDGFVPQGPIPETVRVDYIDYAGSARFNYGGAACYVPKDGGYVRGYTAAGYTVDRWKALSLQGTVTCENDCLAIENTNGVVPSIIIDQIFEPDLSNALKGKTLTLSVMVKSITGKFAFQSGDKSFIITEPGLSYFVIPDWVDKYNYGMRLFNSGGAGKIEISAAKLELGSAQTLAHKENGVWVLNEIPDFGEQLRRCQYYAFKPVNVKDYGRIASGIGMSGNFIAFNIPIPHMRNVAPVVTGIGNTCTFWDGMSIQSGTISSFNGTSNEYITLFVSSTSFSVTAGTPFHLLTADILISADL